MVIIGEVHSKPIRIEEIEAHEGHKHIYDLYDWIGLVEYIISKPVYSIWEAVSYVFPHK